LLVSADRLEVLREALDGGLEQLAFGAPLDGRDDGLRGEDAMLERIAARPGLALRGARSVDFEALRRLAAALRGEMGLRSRLGGTSFLAT
jgi:hypothetical protein